MNNSDMPAVPAGKIDIDAPKGGDPFGNYTVNSLGLTKREHFAGLMMQAEKIHHGASGAYGFSIKGAAESAVECADALLAELDKSK
jgi:hypothetical protein